MGICRELLIGASPGNHRCVTGQSPARLPLPLGRIHARTRTGFLFEPMRSKNEGVVVLG